MKIEEYISILIDHQDFISIPDLGSFVCDVQPARFHPTRGTMLPPSKKISFKSNFQTHDASLIRRIMTGERCSKEEATTLVHLFVIEVKKQLEAEKEYRLGQVGVWRFQENLALFFEQESKNNYYSESFGLPELHLIQSGKSVVRKPFFKPKDRPAMAEIEELPEDQYDDQDDLKNTTSSEESSYDDDQDEIEEDNQPIKKKKSYTWMFILGPILLLGVVGGGYFLTMDKHNPDLGSMNFMSGLFSHESAADSSTEDGNKLLPQNESTEASTSSESAQVEPTTEAANSNATPVVVEESVNEPQRKSSPAISETVVSIDDAIQEKTGQFHIIAGGFKSTKKASDLRGQIKSKGIDAGVIAPQDGNNLYRVTLGSYASLEEAHQKAAQLRADFGDGIWVLQF